MKYEEQNTKLNKNKTFIILHNIRSVYNTGSIFRTAEAVGVDKIFLTGHTPTPLDRFGNERSDFNKVSLGAEKSLSWEYDKDIFRTIDKLKKSNIKIVAVEQHKDSILYKNHNNDNTDTVFIFGNEVNGIDIDILGRADQIIEIPMSGKKESLNVSVAVGIILFSNRDRD